jgi:hypothetical protein
MSDFSRLDYLHFFVVSAGRANSVRKLKLTAVFAFSEGMRRCVVVASSVTFFATCGLLLGYTHYSTP